MPIDVQLNVGFLDNWKIIKLRRRIGADAVLSLLKLWCVARTSKPDGNLGHVSPEDLEIMSSWNGSQNAFYETIRDLRLIDETQDGVSIHDWAEHESYANGIGRKREANAENGRKGGLKRVENLKNRQAKACDIPSGCLNSLEAIPSVGLNSLDNSSSDGLEISRLRIEENSVAESSVEKKSIEAVQEELIPSATPAEHKVTEEKPKQEDPDALRVYEHYNSTIDTSHKPSKPQTISNIKSLLKKLMLGSDHIGKKRSQVADYLIEVVNRYKASAVYEKADRQYRFKQSNFWGEKAEWHNYKDEQINHETTPFKEESVADRIRARDLRHAEECRDNFKDSGRDCMEVYGCGQDRCYVCPVQLEKWSGAEQARAMRRLQHP